MEEPKQTITTQEFLKISRDFIDTHMKIEAVDWFLFGNLLQELETFRDVLLEKTRRQK